MTDGNPAPPGVPGVSMPVASSLRTTSTTTSSTASGVADWKSGLTRDLTHAPLFYGVIVAATLVGIGINFLGISPITALVFSAAINGLLAAPILVLVMLLANNRTIMGERTNGRWLNVIGWATTLLMGVAAIALIVTTVLH